MSEQTTIHPAGKWRRGGICPRCDRATTAGCGTILCPVADIIERRKPSVLRDAVVPAHFPPTGGRESVAELVARADAFRPRHKPDRYDDEWVAEHLNDALGG